MKKAAVVVPFENGLHVRPASKLARVARRFRSKVTLKSGPRLADCRSVVSLLLLCATLSTPLEVIAAGDDEDVAIQAVVTFFEQTPVGREAEDIIQGPEVFPTFASPATPPSAPAGLVGDTPVPWRPPDG